MCVFGRVYMYTSINMLTFAWWLEVTSCCRNTGVMLILWAVSSAVAHSFPCSLPPNRSWSAELISSLLYSKVNRVYPCDAFRRKVRGQNIPNKAKLISAIMESERKRRDIDRTLSKRWIERNPEDMITPPQRMLPDAPSCYQIPSFNGTLWCLHRFTTASMPSNSRIQGGPQHMVTSSTRRQSDLPS